MESAAVPVEAGGVAPGDKGLKSGALGYLSNLVIGVASTAPGYSLAATLGFVTAVAGMGFHAPGAVLGRTAYKLVHVAERPVLVVRA